MYFLAIIKKKKKKYKKHYLNVIIIVFTCCKLKMYIFRCNILRSINIVRLEYLLTFT